MKKNIPAILSAATLPSQYTISSPRTFINEFRESALRKAREHRAMTIEDVSKSAGVPPKDLSRIESGKVTESDIMYLCSLAELYELDCYYVLAVHKLANKKHDTEFGLAAHGQQELDASQRETLSELIKKIKEI